MSQFKAYPRLRLVREAAAHPGYFSLRYGLTGKHPSPAALQGAQGF
jgi:hypothetical protein